MKIRKVAVKNTGLRSHNVTDCNTLWELLKMVVPEDGSCDLEVTINPKENKDEESRKGLQDTVEDVERTTDRNHHNG